MPQCSGYARFELKFDNIPHGWEDTIYGNGLFFNSFTAIRVRAGTKNSRPVAFLQ